MLGQRNLNSIRTILKTGKFYVESGGANDRSGTNYFSIFWCNVVGNLISISTSVRLQINVL